MKIIVPEAKEKNMSGWEDEFHRLGDYFSYWTSVMELFTMKIIAPEVKEKNMSGMD